jgi:hypothetical protein
MPAKLIKSASSLIHFGFELSIMLVNWSFWCFGCFPKNIRMVLKDCHADNTALLVVGSYDNPSVL